MPNNTALSIICVLISFGLSTQTGQAQITMEDIEAGFEENQSKLFQGGLRVQFVTEFRPSVEAHKELIKRQIQILEVRLTQSPNENDRFTLQNSLNALKDSIDLPPISAEWNFDIVSHESGYLIRESQSNPISEDRSIPQDGLLFAETLGLYDLKDDQHYITSYLFDHDDPERSIFTHVDRRNNLKHFTVTRDSPLRQLQTKFAFSKSGLVSHNRFNTPFRFPFDNGSAVFLPADWLIYGWLPYQPFHRNLETLPNGNILIRIEEAIDFPITSHNGILQGNVVNAEIAPHEGYLPVKIEFWNRISDDGRVLDNATNKPPSPVIEFANAKLDNGGFYARETKSTHYLFKYPTLPDKIGASNTREAYVWLNSQPLSADVEKQVLSVNVTRIVHIERWKPSDDFKFSPNVPEGVRYFDATTGESRLDDAGQKKLELDLARGDIPILDDFRVRSQSIFSFAVLVRVLFWMLMTCVGLWIIYSASKTFNKN